jgi:cytoskeletal protein RodZ
VAAFGEELRRAREERGLAIEAISEATKVPVRHIRALEAGEYGELPGGVFRRGFVRSYLKVLGLEEDVWMQSFEQSCRESGLKEATPEEWEKFAENVRKNRVVQRRRRGIKRVGVGIILVALALGGWFVWLRATHRGIPRLAPILRVLKSSVDNAPQR